MAIRDYTKHLVSTSAPTASNLGDEWFNPTTNRLYKQVATNGTTVEWKEILGTLPSDTDTAIRFPVADTVTIETAGVERLRVTSAGNVGIGTDAPVGKLHVTSELYPVALIERTSTSTNEMKSSIVAQHTTTGDMVDGFGTDISFRIKDSSDVNNEIATFGVIRDGSDTSAAFKFMSRSSGTWSEKLRISANGAISLGAAPGSESLRVTRVASAVNYVNVYGSATAQGSVIRFEGSDTNVFGYYDTKGTGNHQFRTNAYGGAPTQFNIAHTASAVNYLQVTGAATGVAPILSAQGSDTNISIVLTPKGTGNVGIGTTAPTYKLHISGSTKTGGILVEDSNTAAAAPAIEVIGKRSDPNGTSAFSGKLLLAANRTDAATATNSALGVMAFGGNHTDGTLANILYSASIVGVSEGAFSNATTMPTGLAFYTGSTGRDPDTANVTIGTERMRIDSAGRVGIGGAASTPHSLRVVRQITGDPFSIGILSDGQVQSAVTSRADYFLSAHNVAAGTYPIINGHQAQQGTLTGTVTQQRGFSADGSLIGATNNFGFYGDIPSGTGRWNFYANGTADNYFAGKVGVGTATPAQNLQVSSSVDAVALVTGGSTAAGYLAVNGNARSSLTGATTLISYNTGVAELTNRSNQYFAFGTNSTEYARIGSTGIISLAGTPGAESLRVTPTASSVNYFTIAGSATTGAPTLNAQGSDTNIGAGYISKGTGTHFFATGGLGGNVQFNIAHTASAVNYIQVTGAATGDGPILSAVGSDTNINIVLTPKGTGTVNATTFVGALTGNASTATTLQTARTINGTSFNGSANITVTASTTNALTIGTGLSGTSFNGGSAVTIAIDSTVATLTGTQTLTNKTLTFPVIDNIRMGISQVATAAGTTVLTATSAHQQRFTGSTTQTITLPVTSTLAAGVTYSIENVSTGNLTINSSGGNLVATVIPGTTIDCTCIGTTLTTAADWDAEYTAFATITGTGSVVMSSSPTLVSPALGTPASGVVTNLTGTASININGTVGATTANTGSFTTLAASSPASFAAGTAALPAITRTGDTNTGIFFPAADTIAFSEGGAESMRIDSSGNVGIGTAAPTLPLNIGTSTLPAGVTIAGQMISSDVAGAAPLLSIRRSAASGNPIFAQFTSSGTAASPTAIVANRGLGRNDWWGFDGTNYINAAAITVAADGTVSTGVVPGRMVFSTSATSTPVERMRIDSAGNVGIGTSTPGAALHVAGAITAAPTGNGVFSGLDSNNYGTVQLNGSVGGYIDFSTSGTDFKGRIIYTHSEDSLAFLTNSAERMRITSAGNLYVGTTSPFYGTKAAIHWNSAAEQGLLFKSTSTTFNGSPLVFLNNADGISGLVAQSQTAVAYSTSSDYRLKDNVAPMTGALAKVAALKPCTYTWKVNGSAGQGFIAHELQNVVPDCVTGTKDGIDQDGRPQYQGVDTSFLVATLVAAIQEQQTIIAQLQVDVATLKGN